MSMYFKIVNPEDLHAWDVIVGMKVPFTEAFTIFDEPVTVTARDDNAVYGSCNGRARDFRSFPTTRFLARIDVS